jgi:hypothetical protein
MSDNQGATSAPTLEEALAEIEGLKEQLSGSDLKVFTQNRELRQENARLREEVTRLTEECVTQTFAVRGLEKTRTNLEKQVATLQSQVAGLEGQVTGLEGQVSTLEARIADMESRNSDLTEQLGVHRSQEIQLSQELERTISTNAEEVSRLRSEHSQEIETTRQTLEEARAQLEAELKARLEAKAREVEGLERRVEQFKEEFLSQELVPVSQQPSSEATGGRAFHLLRSKMEGLLGFPGKTLVEQVFRHCGADESTTDPAVLEEAFEALQDTAGKLVRNPEQEQELISLLKSVWQELGLGASGAAEAAEAPAAAAKPAQVPADAAGEGVEAAAPSPQTGASSTERASAEEVPASASAEQASPSVQAAVEAPPAASESAAAAEPAQENVGQSVAEVAPEPLAEAASEVAAEPAVETAPEAVAEAEAVVEPASEVAAEPAAETAPEAVAQAEAAAGAETAEVAPGSIAEAAPEPIAEAAPEPIAEAASEPIAEAASEPITEAAPEPEAEESQRLGESAPAPAQQPGPELAVEEAAARPLEQAAPSPVTVDPETLPAPQAAAEQPSQEEALPDSEVVTEEDLPVVAAPSPEAEQAPVYDSIDEALAQPPEEEPSVEGAASGEEVVPVPAEVPSAAEQAAPESEAATPAGSAGQEPANEDADFDAAAAALQNGDFVRAFPTFHALRQSSPQEPTYLVGEIAALTGLERFEEAYALGKGVDVSSLDDSADVFRESFESALVGLAEQAESMLVRKGYLIELANFVEDPERVMAYLDEAEEIALRTSREGDLSLLQARHRIGHDDVTEYLIEALNSLSDEPEIFTLLRQNLERYPELAPLSQFLERMLDSSRDDALEAETGAKELISTGESLEELLEEVDPGEEALVQVFLEHLLPRTGVKVDLPSESFEDLLQESEPAAFVGALRQALRSVDYTLFFDEIEVLAYDGDEHFLLRSSPEPKATLLFGPDVDDVPPEELRFLVLRELFSMYRRHSHLAHLAAQLDDALRYTFVKTCLEIHKEAEFQIPEALLAELGELESLAQEGGQDPEFKAKLEAGLGAIYQATESDSFLELADFLYDGQLHKKWLDPLADGFAAKQTGLVVASFAIARDALDPEDFEALEESGFQWLYQPENVERFRDLRLRLQRLWAMPFKALVADAEGEEE